MIAERRKDEREREAKTLLQEGFAGLPEDKRSMALTCITVAISCFLYRRLAALYGKLLI
jgi:cell division protein FtsX